MGKKYLGARARSADELMKWWLINWWSADPPDRVVVKSSLWVRRFRLSATGGGGAARLHLRLSVTPWDHDPSPWVLAYVVDSRTGEASARRSWSWTSRAAYQVTSDYRVGVYSIPGPRPLPPPGSVVGSQRQSAKYDLKLHYRGLELNSLRGCMDPWLIRSDVN